MLSFICILVSSICMRRIPIEQSYNSTLSDKTSQFFGRLTLRHGNAPACSL